MPHAVRVGYWITALIVSLVPLGFHIAAREANGFRFYGRLSIPAFIRLYRWRSITYFLSVLLESLLVGGLVLCVILDIGLPWSRLS